MESAHPSTRSQKDAGELFLCLLLLTQIVLIGFTWPLWTTVDRFPAIPLLPCVAPIPVAVDRMFTAILCFASGCASWLIWKDLRRSRMTNGDRQPQQRFLKTLLTTAALCGVGLCVLNQHRLQAWHWLFLILLAQRVTLAEFQRTQVFCATIACLYIFAALSRMGPDVDDGMSRQMLVVLAELLGAQTVLQNPTLVTGLCLSMSLFELMVGLALLFPTSRRSGVAGAVLVHAVLLITLSPLGLNHHYGVLVWNVCLMMLVPILCWPNLHHGASTTQVRGRDRWSIRVWIILLLAWPASGLWGIADNWLSWQLYSPRPEVVRIFVRHDVVDQLPHAVQSITGSPALLDHWCPVRIDRWSLQGVQAPVYPEDRFQLGVAAWVASQLNSAEDIRIELDQPAFPVWWHRERIPIPADRIAEFASERFFWNSTILRKP